MASWWRRKPEGSEDDDTKQIISAIKEQSEQLGTDVAQLQEDAAKIKSSSDKMNLMLDGVLKTLEGPHKK